MSNIDKQWLQQKIADMEATRDDIPFGLGEDGTNTLAALRIALASLEADASGRNPVLAYADSYRDMAKQGVESIPVWSVITDLERNIAPLYTTPPAPVSVPAAMEMDDDFDSAFEHGKAVGWNAYRAAMLQGAEPAKGWIPCSERMPEEIGRYWCYVEEQNCLGKSHYQWNCSWNGDRWWVESENGGRVTHWMPLPNQPKE
ncbi:DUF551 domain-containing protein [Enterobacter hormaechei]|uniref:DUF551 domain-containing protein n=1 Tax=Enterobacter hormaechei TaxID=158836 RepID=UPI004043D46B